MLKRMVRFLHGWWKEPLPDFERVCESYEAETGLSNDPDDDLITTQFDALYRNIRDWCHQHAQRNPMLNVEKSFRYLDFLKPGNVSVDDLLEGSRSAPCVSRAFISYTLQDTIFDAIGKGKDIWTTEAVAMAMSMIEEEMSGKGIGQKHINLWRSLTTRALYNRRYDGKMLDSLETQRIQERILHWMETSFGLSGKGDSAHISEVLKSTIIFYASWLLLDIRKRSSTIEIKLYFDRKDGDGQIEFRDDCMEDIEDRRDVVAPTKVKLVVTPALLRHTGAGGNRLDTPKVLKKAQVLLQAS